MVDGNGCVTQVHEVKFAGQDWYVIGYDDVCDPYSEGATRITLLSKNPTPDTMTFAGSTNVYSTSHVKTYLASFYDSKFTKSAKEAILSRTLEGDGNTGDTVNAAANVTLRMTGITSKCSTKSLSRA